MSTLEDPRTFGFLAMQSDPLAGWQVLQQQIAHIGFENAALVHSIPVTDQRFPSDDQILGVMVDHEFHQFHRTGEAKGIDYGTTFQAHHKGARGLIHLIAPAEDLLQKRSVLEADHIDAMSTAVDLGLYVGSSIPLLNKATQSFTLLMLWSNDPEPFIKHYEAQRSAAELCALYFNEGLQVRQLVEQGGACLSKRETECLAWVGAGLSSKRIADRLLISESTVNEYLSSATRKLGAVNRAQAAARAMLLGHFKP